MRRRVSALRRAVRAVVAAGAGLLTAAPAATTQTAPAPPLAAAVPQAGPGHSRGRADAPVVVVEFADFACVECARFAAETLPLVLEHYVEPGLVLFRFVPFNLGAFRPGAMAARAAECAAGQAAFWPMHDLLYARQREWLARGGQAVRFRQWADELGLDVERFSACMDDVAVRDRIDANTDSARALGVRATPTFRIDDVVLYGAVGGDRFRQALDAAVARAHRRGPP